MQRLPVLTITTVFSLVGFCEQRTNNRGTLDGVVHQAAKLTDRSLGVAVRATRLPELLL